jgi:hypothetical protein
MMLKKRKMKSTIDYKIRLKHVGRTNLMIGESLDPMVHDQGAMVGGSNVHNGRGPIQLM